MPKSSFLDRKDDPPRSCNSWFTFLEIILFFLGKEGGKLGIKGCEAVIHTVTKTFLRFMAKAKTR